MSDFQTPGDQTPRIETLEFVVTDPNGRARGKWGPAASLAKARGAGINFPLSLHGLDVWGTEVPETGLHISSGDRDGFFRAVEGTLTPVPGRPGSAQVLLETFTPEGEPFGGCSRQVLRRAVERLSADGLSATVAFEVEFHLLDPQGNVSEAHAMGDTQQMYALDRLADHDAVLDAVREAGAAAGIPIDTIVKEAAPGQYEINLTHRPDALRAADDVVLLRRIADAAARAAGLRASFMAKPFAEEAGNGMHVHCSLVGRDGRNIFESDETRLEHAAAALVARMPETALVFLNTWNGFRRIAPGSYAPCNANWGRNNRSVAVRVPASPPAARRLEHRIAGADANPYLVLAVILEGMREGLRERRPPPPPVEGNAYDETTPNRGVPLSPRMTEALELYGRSEHARDALGVELFSLLRHLKRAEVDRFERRIEPFERGTYL